MSRRVSEEKPEKSFSYNRTQNNVEAASSERQRDGKKCKSKTWGQGVWVKLQITINAMDTQRSKGKARGRKLKKFPERTKIW